MPDTLPEQYITAFGLAGTADYDYDYSLVDLPPHWHTLLIVSPSDTSDFDRFQHILADRMIPIVEIPVQVGSPLVSIANTPSLEEGSSVEGGVIDETSQRPTSKFRKIRKLTSGFIKAVRRRFHAARQMFRL
ncbi:hypothetical protein QCA50_019439 [Cerrena zonata]|uniref:Uncharacterized protein n=1 Tax=Cerrena zonata TaxID=2478898 RepID=A0AAW0FJ09_9APHY